MIEIVKRLEFEDVFADEEKKDALEYLTKISKETLLRIIGFFNTHSLPNFDNIFTNPKIAKDVEKRVKDYCLKNNVTEKPETISRQGSLKISELILSNKSKLLERNTDSSVDDDEVNLFKAFLVINKELNNVHILDNIPDLASNYEKLVDLVIIHNFPIADLAIFKNDYSEFVKLIYTTLIKVQYLFDFLDSKPRLKNLKTLLIKSFNTDSQEDFFREMKYLFSHLLELKASNNYIFRVDNVKSERFIISMTSDDTLTDEDFTYIKIHPLYQIKEHTYSIVNYFYVVDKFYRSSKFKIKEFYEADDSLRSEDFFGFFNKQFSENFLMKNILDEIFHQPYCIKKPENESELNGEPDYYIRHGNNIFIFENKDVLIAKAIKASSDIEKINGVLKTKFLEDKKGKGVGIGQLINTIEEILNKKYRFDSYVNTKNNLKIYPILLVHDRIFQTPGINYKLNSWFLESLNNRLSARYNLCNIRSLTVMDIDTLILWSPYLKEKDRRFRDVIDGHLRKLNKKGKINTSDYEYWAILSNIHLTEQITPIASRKIPYELPTELFIDKFRDITKD